MIRKFLLLFSICSYNVFGQNTVPSIISVNTTLTKDKSPYTLTGTTINTGVALTIESGVTVNFMEHATITVRGSLIANGNENDTVIFASKGSANYGKITTESGSTVKLNYVKGNTDNMFLYGSGNSLLVSHCNITSSATGNGEDCIEVHDFKRVVIEYCTLRGHGGNIEQGEKNDAIDMDHCDSCFVSFNDISYFADDAVDCGTQSKYAYIHDNIMTHCNYGASIGESTLAYVINNISRNNDGGLEVHDSATVFCENNILYGNTYGIDVFHREYAPTQTGGIVKVKNTIFSQNSNDLGMQTSSSATISYSLSDKDTLEGIHNLFGDPMFTNPEQGDFTLKTGSPALNAGVDENGNPINMGIANSNNPGDGITTNISNDILDVFPNPVMVKAKINIISNHEENFEISVISMEGKIVNRIFSGKLNAGKHTFEWNPERSIKGFYIISVKTGDGSLNRKVLVR